MKKFLLITGILFLLSPLFLHWFLHGSYERYLWIINGPYPLSHMGSALVQLLMYGGFILVGVVSVGVGYLRK